ncbi:MAG TPA: hypothetical protein VJ890_07600 [Vineibacter sp.]|nr:hypothetical protein [Vineibacter sp.]
MSEADQDSGVTPADSDAGAAAPTDVGRPVTDVTEFPVNWRELAASGDRDVATLLGRYESPKAMARALKDMRTELSRRGAKAGPPAADAPPEAIAAWRRAQGVPARWQDYGTALALPEAMVLGEADAPVVDGFFQAAHAADLPQRHVDAMLRWYFSQRERQDIERINADDEARESTAATLRQDWGAHYGRNVNLIAAKLRPTFAAFGTDLFDRLLLARMPDGRVIGDDAAMSRALYQLAMDLDPASRPTPGEPVAHAAAIAGRRAEIEAIMAGPDANTRYWGDQTLQAEYRTLLAAEPRPRRRAG